MGSFNNESWIFPKSYVDNVSTVFFRTYSPFDEVVPRDGVVLPFDCSSHVPCFFGIVLHQVVGQMV